MDAAQASVISQQMRGMSVVGNLSESFHPCNWGRRSVGFHLDGRGWACQEKCARIGEETGSIPVCVCVCVCVRARVSAPECAARSCEPFGTTL